MNVRIPSSSGARIIPLRRGIYSLVAVAATLFLAGWLGLKWWTGNSWETVTALANVGEIQLEDGTRVFLNAGSELKYSRNFSKKERRVKLRGEGFFEVTEDSERPFSI